jgi:serine/threonine-protein kinase
MELVKGLTLEQLLQDGRTFTASDATRLGVQLCQAVSAVHAAGLLHRDIKTQNVMVEEGGRLVLMDFGTGRELDDSTATGVAGTPLYLAPEVLAGGAATPRSDVYSIGVVLFRLLTASYPVSGTDLADLRRAHADGTGAAGRAEQPGIAPRLRRVIARAIDPDSERRYASAEALGSALAALERVSTARRAGYVAASAAALVVLLGGGWNLGLREVLLPAPEASARAARTPAIAVLPVNGTGSDTTSDDFVDGLTSEVIRNLAAIDGLQVRAQASSFFLKDRPRDPREIADTLAVDFVLYINLQRSDNRLRLNPQLVRVPDDVLVWTDRFDGMLDDVFVIQDELSRAIVNALRLPLGAGQRQYRTDLATYDLYLRGRALVERRGTDGAEEAVRLFEQVIAIDPEFTPAHAGLADAYATMAWSVDDPVLADALAGMRPAAIRALQLDPGLAEAHAAMGITYARELEWGQARSSFERALELEGSSNLSQIRTSYVSSTLLPQGYTAEALEVLAVAIEADPLSLGVKREVGIALYVAGRYEEAVAILRQVIAADPDLTYVPNVLARSLTLAGRPEEAIALWASRPEHAVWERWLMPAYVSVGRRSDVERLLANPRNAHPYRQALNYAALGDKDRTFDALSRAADVAPLRTAAVLAYPEMALLRGDARLEPLRRRLNLR